MVFLVAAIIGGYLVLLLLRQNESGESEVSDAYVVGEVYEGDIANDASDY